MTDPLNGVPIERRQADLAGVNSAKTYLYSALGMTVLMVLVVLALTMTRPETLELKQVKNMGYFLALIIVGLFAGAGINIVNVLNGHQALMLRLVGEKERAKGVIEGLKQNPDMNIQ